MQLSFICPRCGNPARAALVPDAHAVACRNCDWSRPVGTDCVVDGTPRRCLVCGCEDLWRQKDFPQRLGLAIVGLGILLSTVAYAYWRPVLALGILMLFALADLLLYTFMKDVLVCYRCGARHHSANLDREHPQFNLETAERYRQEAKRLAQAGETGAAEKN